MSTEIVKSPMLMLQEQLDKGVSVEQLKGLMDLAERYDKIQAEKAWNHAMTACQRDMPGLVKSSHNKHKDIWYAGFEQLDKQIRPIYLREGFSLCFTELEQDNKEVCRMAVDILHVDGHSRRFQKDVHIDGVGIKGNANMTATQADGSTSSYARRYVTKMAFNLVESTDEDTDGDAGNNGRITAAEAKLLIAAVGETAFVTGTAVDIGAALRFASPDLKRAEDMNREQYLRVMNDLGFRRQKAQEAERKGGK